MSYSLNSLKRVIGDYSPAFVDRIWLWVHGNLHIAPYSILLKGDYIYGSIIGLI